MKCPVAKKAAQKSLQDAYQKINREWVKNASPKIKALWARERKLAAKTDAVSREMYHGVVDELIKLANLPPTRGNLKQRKQTKLLGKDTIF